MTNEITLTNPADHLFADEKVRQQLMRALNYEMIRGTLGIDSFYAAVKEDIVSNRQKGGKTTLWDAFIANPGSAISALSRAAQCKLLPGSAYGQFYLIPRLIKGRLEVVGQLGYKGLCTMSTRHERVHSVEAFVVYEGEEFDCDLASGFVHHKWNPKVERVDDAMIAAYAKVIITEESSKHAVIDKPIIWPMDKASILKRRDASDAYRNAKKYGNDNTPWIQWQPEMWRKTTLIGVLNHGSVPQDMGMGGMLSREAEEDRVRDVPSLQAPSRGAEMRQVLGVEKPAVEFSFAEEAVACIEKCATVQELQDAAMRWQHFQGIDAETIATAYEAREEQLAP